jgi:hypothetical protein
MGNTTTAWRWLTAAILVHFVIALVHGMAHAQANVPLSRAGTLFVFAVILAGPLLGLALTWPAQRIGGALIAVTMAASLVFGVVNHFWLSSPDHVSHVEASWRTLFAATAALLAVTETLGTGLAVRFARERKSTS